MSDVASRRSRAISLGLLLGLGLFQRCKLSLSQHQTVLVELQADLDSWITEYNEARPHQGGRCFGKTFMQTFLDAMPMTKEKMIAA
jgi:Integrase core domain